MRIVVNHAMKICCLRALPRRLLQCRRSFLNAPAPPPPPAEQKLGSPPPRFLGSFSAHRSSSPSLHPCCSRSRGLRTHRLATKPLGENSSSGLLPTDYSSLLDEREFHKLADELLHHIQEKVDELGEEHDIEGFDIDHAEGVLTIKLGASGTYVINKQTPNRQIWLSSPVSGPARFDWDAKDQCWVYRRTKSKILGLLEKEMNQLLCTSISLSR